MPGLENPHDQLVVVYLKRLETPVGHKAAIGVNAMEIRASIGRFSWLVSTPFLRRK
jgi:hypothetical protein